MLYHSGRRFVRNPPVFTAVPGPVPQSPDFTYIKISKCYRAQVHFACHRRGQQNGSRVAQAQSNDFTGKTSKLRRSQTRFSKNGLPAVQSEAPFKHKSGGEGPSVALTNGWAGQPTVASWQLLTKSQAWGRSPPWRQPTAERLLVAGACLTASEPGAERCDCRKWPGLKKYPTPPAMSSSTSRWMEAFRKQNPL